MSTNIKTFTLLDKAEVVGYVCSNQSLWDIVQTYMTAEQADKIRAKVAQQDPRSRKMYRELGKGLYNARLDTTAI